MIVQIRVAVRTTILTFSETCFVTKFILMKRFRIRCELIVPTTIARSRENDRVKSLAHASGSFNRGFSESHDRPSRQTEIWCLEITGFTRKFGRRLGETLAGEPGRRKTLCKSLRKQDVERWVAWSSLITALESNPFLRIVSASYRSRARCGLWIFRSIVRDHFDVDRGRKTDRRPGKWGSPVRMTMTTLARACPAWIRARDHQIGAGDPPRMPKPSSAEAAANY